MSTDPLRVRRESIPVGPSLASPEPQNPSRWVVRCRRLSGPTVKERIVGSLKGIATGDAIGKQTEMLSREGVVRWYRNGVRGFEGPPGTVIPRSVGSPRREWRH